YFCGFVSQSALHGCWRDASTIRAVGLREALASELPYLGNSPQVNGGVRKPCFDGLSRPGECIRQLRTFDEGIEKASRKSQETVRRAVLGAGRFRFRNQLCSVRQAFHLLPSYSSIATHLLAGMGSKLTDHSPGLDPTERAR